MHPTLAGCTRDQHQPINQPALQGQEEYASDSCWVHQGSTPTNQSTSTTGSGGICIRLLLGAPGINTNQSINQHYRVRRNMHPTLAGCTRDQHQPINQPALQGQEEYASDSCWVHQGSTPINQSTSTESQVKPVRHAAPDNQAINLTICFILRRKGDTRLVFKYSLLPQTSTSIV